MPVRIIAAPRRRRIAWTLLILLVLLLGGLMARRPAERALSATLRARAVSMLEERLESKVEIGALDISFGASIRVHGANLAIHHHRRTDVPPLVSIGQFRTQVPWSSLFRSPRRLSSADLDRLRIVMPPDADGVRDRDSGGCRDRREPDAGAGAPAKASPFLLDRLVSRDAELVLLPSRPGKTARVFSIRDLVIRDLALDRAATFDAQLLNPVPRGSIATRGEFGPWNARDPSATPVRGRYTFSDADLSTISGIAGMLDSTGTFAGPLRQIVVNGETRVPEFGLATTRNRLPLVTRFHACVDGTDGDTYLDSVEATLRDTTIVASGRVEGRVGVAGRTIALDVPTVKGPIEDLLRLVVDDATPLLFGGVDAHSTLLIEPGAGDFVDRLRLDGAFTLDHARMTEGTLQRRIDELSRRARGDIDSSSARLVQWRVEGRFLLAGGVLNLPGVLFAVPGALLRFGGTYGLKTERLNFKGRLRLEARASEMTTGWRSKLLKPIDPILARDGAGMIVPMSITGSRKAPSVKVDVKGTLFGEKSSG